MFPSWAIAFNLHEAFFKKWWNWTKINSIQSLCSLVTLLQKVVMKIILDYLTDWLGMEWLWNEVTVKQQDFCQSSDFNHMLHGVFVAVIDAQRLEVCIHKHCTVEKLSEIQLKNMHEWYDTCTVSITIIIIYMKKLLDSDWLRAVQFFLNTVQKRGN